MILTFFHILSQVFLRVLLVILPAFHFSHFVINKNLYRITKEKLLYMKKQVLLNLICIALIILFTYAAFSKLFSFTAFIKAMQSQPLPAWLIQLSIFVLPVIELTVPILLLPDKTRKTGLYLSLLLFMLFTAYSEAIIMHQFSHIPCSCGGLIQELSWKQHLFLNFTGMALTITAITIHKNKLPKKQPKIIDGHQSGSKLKTCKKE